MSLLHRGLEAVASGLLVALLAPPVAGVLFLLSSVAWSAGAGETLDPSPSSILLLALGVTTGAYLLGVVPAFLAGLALPTLGRLLTPVLASAATGLIGTALYWLLSGSHLMSRPRAIESTLIYTLPAMTGVAVAAFLALRIERHYAEA